MSVARSNRKVTTAALALVLAAGFAAPALAQGDAGSWRYDRYLAQEEKAQQQKAKQAQQFVRSDDGSASDAGKDLKLSPFERSGSVLDFKRDQHNRGR